MICVLQIIHHKLLSNTTALFLKFTLNIIMFTPSLTKLTLSSAGEYLNKQKLMTRTENT